MPRSFGLHQNPDKRKNETVEKGIEFIKTVGSFIVPESELVWKKAFDLNTELLTGIISVNKAVKCKWSLTYHVKIMEN